MITTEYSVAGPADSHTAHQYKEKMKMILNACQAAVNTISQIYRQERFVRINLNLDNINYNTQPDRASYRAKAERIVNDLFSCEEEFNGWVFIAQYNYQNCRAKWRILHLQNGEKCRGYSDHQAMKNPLQT